VSKPVAKLHIQAQGKRRNWPVHQNSETIMSNIHKYAPVISNGLIIEEWFGPAFGNYLVVITTSDDALPALASQIE
jgi:hypothetical protein